MEQVLNLRVFYGFLVHSCTQDFPVVHTHDLDAPTQRHTCAHLSLCSAQAGNSAYSPWQNSFLSVLVLSLESLLAACHPCRFPDSPRGVIVRNTSVPTLRSVRFGRDFWIVVGRVNSGGRVYCGADRELLILGYGSRGKYSNAIGERPVARRCAQIPSGRK